MQAHVLCEDEKVFCLAKAFRCVLIPSVWIENPGFLLVNQLSNVVFDPYPYEARVSLYMLRF